MDACVRESFRPGTGRLRRMDRRDGAARGGRVRNAYNTAVVSDAREFASQFLQELTVRWDGTNVVERTVRKLAGEAAEHYAVVAETLAEMREMFPFPQGGAPREAASAGRAVALLHRAKEAETHGMEC
jgi:hypothetical protein